MRKLFMLMVAVLCGSYTLAAEEESCTPSLTVKVKETKDGIPADMHERLAAILRQAITLNGIEGGDKVANFDLIASTHEVGKEMLAGQRPLVTVTVELRMYVSSTLTNEKFASTSINLSGAGRNEHAAYRAAISSVNGKNRPIQLFLQDAHRRIMAFYDNQAPFIIKKAKAEAAQYNFERAMFLLQTIPLCSRQYDKAEKAMKEVFQQYLDRDCAAKIAKARNIWNANQNRDGALVAGAYLAAIDPNSSCTSDAEKLEKAIKERIGDEWEFYKQMKRDSLKLEEQYIDALKVIGKAYAKNQGDTTVHIEGIAGPEPLGNQPDVQGDEPSEDNTPQADADDQDANDEADEADDGEKANDEADQSDDEAE